MSVEVAVVRLPHAAGLPLPAYATDGAAGMAALVVDGALDLDELRAHLAQRLPDPSAARLPPARPRATTIANAA
jgi:dUTPase